MKGNELSFNEAVKEIALRLIVRDLDKIEITEIISEYIPVNLIESNLHKIFRGGFKVSFKSSNPFLASGIFYKNCKKCLPNAFLFLSDTSSKMFKNMIMAKSPSKIVISNYADYHNVREKFNKNFEIEPPSLNSIFDAILNDKKSLEKIVRNPQFRNNIESIFVDLGSQELNKLDEKLLETINERIDNLKFKKMFIVEERSILSINKEIEMLEMQIHQLN